MSILSKLFPKRDPSYLPVSRAFRKELDKIGESGALRVTANDTGEAFFIIRESMHNKLLIEAGYEAVKKENAA